MKYSLSIILCLADLCTLNFLGLLRTSSVILYQCVLTIMVLERNRLFLSSGQFWANQLWDTSNFSPLDVALIKSKTNISQVKQKQSIKTLFFKCLYIITKTNKPKSSSPSLLKQKPITTKLPLPLFHNWLLSSACIRALSVSNINPCIRHYKAWYEHASLEGRKSEPKSKLSNQASNENSSKTAWVKFNQGYLSRNSLGTLLEKESLEEEEEKPS